MGKIRGMYELLTKSPAVNLFSTFVAVVVACYFVFDLIFVQPRVEEIKSKYERIIDLKDDIGDLKSEIRELKSDNTEKDNLISGYVSGADQMNREYGVRTREYAQAQSELAQQRETVIRQNYDHRKEIDEKNKTIAKLKESVKPDTIYLNTGYLRSIDEGEVTIRCDNVYLEQGEYQCMRVTFLFRDRPDEYKELYVHNVYHLKFIGKLYHISVPHPSQLKNDETRSENTVGAFRTYPLVITVEDPNK